MGMSGMPHSDSKLDLGCIPKQLDLYIAHHSVTGFDHNGALTLSSTLFQEKWLDPPLRTLLRIQSHPILRLRFSQFT